MEKKEKGIPKLEVQKRAASRGGNEGSGKNIGTLQTSPEQELMARIRWASLSFWRTNPGMGSERTVALGKLNLLLIAAQSVKGYPKEKRTVRGKLMNICRMVIRMENRTVEIMEGVMLDGQSERYYNGRWHETI